MLFKNYSSPDFYGFLKQFAHFYTQGFKHGKKEEKEQAAAYCICFADAGANGRAYLAY